MSDTRAAREVLRILDVLRSHAEYTIEFSHKARVAVGNLVTQCDQLEAEMCEAHDAETFRREVLAMNQKRSIRAEHALALMVRMAEHMPTFPGTPMHDVLSHWFDSALIQAKQALKE